MPIKTVPSAITAAFGDPDPYCDRLEAAYTAAKIPLAEVVERCQQAVRRELEAMGFMVEVPDVDLNKPPDQEVGTKPLFHLGKIISRRSVAQIRNGMIRSTVRAYRYVNSNLTGNANDMNVFEQFTTDAIGQEHGIDNYESFEKIKWGKW